LHPQLLSCKATHLDYLANISSPFALLSLRAQQFEDPSGPQECIQLYDAQLMRCETLNKCCPEMEMSGKINNQNGILTF
jgi:hypothetical protein